MPGVRRADVATLPQSWTGAPHQNDRGRHRLGQASQLWVATSDVVETVTSETETWFKFRDETETVIKAETETETWNFETKTRDLTFL